jgi:predicted enzyme related to lactoylglutathione lyase
MQVLRSLTRVFLPPEALGRSIAFYETLSGEPARMRFVYPAAGLELAEVGGVLLIAGKEHALAPFSATRATFIVDHLDEFRAALVGMGAAILDEPKPVPAGRNMRVRHPDGTVVEYVEHDASLRLPPIVEDSCAVA